MADGDFQDLPRRLASDKVLRDRTVNFAKNPKNNEYPRALASMIYKLFDKKSLKMHRLITQEQELFQMQFLRTNN